MTKPTKPQILTPIAKPTILGRPVSRTDEGNVRTINPPKQAPSFARPDWKQSGSYAHLENAPLRAIAWEFLRRNADYQKAWDEYAARVRGLAVGDAELSRYVELILSSNATEQDWADFGGSEKADALSSRLDEAGHFQKSTTGSTFNQLDAIYGEPWGIEFVANPNADFQAARIRFIESAGVVNYPVQNIVNCAESVPSDVFGLRDTKWLALLIDLSLPLAVIDAQLREVVRSQREIKIKAGFANPVLNRALSTRKYVEYLRILDAAHAGLTAPEIGKNIAPGRRNDGEERQRDKQFAASLAEAKRLQTDGYRVLPLLTFASKKRQCKK
jgi:hypothetical protein